MLEFIAQTAKDAGLTDYQVVANVGPRAGQTVFHLHWHVLGNSNSVGNHDAERLEMTAVTEL
jgi:diadenosine tetraphosphate (Ap4A) HIT family hydrolase